MIQGGTRLAAVHVIAGLEDRDGGPAYSAPRLCAALEKAACAVRLLNVGARDPQAAPLPFPSEAFRNSLGGLPLLGALRASAPLLAELRRIAGEADIFHTHGLWLAPNVYPAWAAAGRGAKARLVMSPRGMMAPEAMRFSPVKKRLFWAAAQRRAVAVAACLHATSEAECADIRAFGVDRPVAVIPNGVDLPPEATQGAAAVRTVLSLGRIHPKKGLEGLLRAWGEVEARHPAWRLRIVGPAERDHDQELRALAADLGLQRVTIEGALFDDRKLAAYREAELFVLPSLNENFGMTVAEALAAGTPVISTKGAPWAGLEAEGCGWWVDHGAGPLAAGLADAMGHSPAALRAMGARGRAWMARDFSWDAAARAMMAVYGWLAQGGERPDCVRIA
jgi:glycosyltransferase involved in cell wall biosynthesis